MPSTAEPSTGFYCFWKSEIPGTKGVGSGVAPGGRIVDTDAGRHVSSLSIPGVYQGAAVFLSDDPHFILTITQEDVQQ